MEKKKKIKSRLMIRFFACLFSFSLAKAISLNAISAFTIVFSHCLRGHTMVVLHVRLVLLRHTSS